MRIIPESLKHRFFYFQFVVLSDVTLLGQWDVWQSHAGAGAAWHWGPSEGERKLEYGMQSM